MSGASERVNGRASGPVLTSRFLFVPDHSAPSGEEVDEVEAMEEEVEEEEEKMEKNFRQPLFTIFFF